MKFFKDKKEWFLLTFVLLFLAIGFCIYPKLPAEVPVHWNAEGNADGYGSKFTASFMMPLMMVGIYVLFLLIPKIAVMKKNLQDFEGHYFAFRVAFTIFLFVVYLSSLVQAFKPFDMNIIIIPLLAFLFMFVAVFLRKTKRNYFIGIRTPWTLNSDYVWKKTHDLGSILFGIYSFLIFSLLILSAKFFIWVIVLPILIIMFIPNLSSKYN